MDPQNPHDNVSFTPAVVSDGQIPIGDTSSSPDEPSHYQASADSGAQPQSVDNDVLMDSDDYDAMPTLQDVSDSDDDSDSDRDAYEVEMEVDTQDSLPILVDAATTLPNSSAYPFSPFQSPFRTNGNRRARVEDDDDAERDRRHPSQRVSSNVASGTSSPSVPLPESSQNQPHIPTNSTAPLHHVLHTLPGNVGPNPFRFFPTYATPQSNNNNAPPTGPAVSGNDEIPPLLPPTNNDNGRPLFSGVSFSVDIGPGFNILVGPGPEPPNIPPAQNVDGQPPPPGNAANPPRFFTDLLGMLGTLGASLPVGGHTFVNFGNMGFGAPEKDDPERAKRLIDGLEVVPVGLVRRLERVGGIGIEAGEEPTNGGDAGCAICWDKLLDADGEGFGKEERAAIDEANKDSEPSSQPESKIVSLPCAHVFHADCLLPWFARPKHTTCPTCRFNIDPEDLTHASMRRRRDTPESNDSQANETEPLPTPSVDGNDRDDGHPPDVTFIPGGETEGQGATRNRLRQQEINNELLEIAQEYFRRRNQRATNAANPTPADPLDNMTASPRPSNNESHPSSSGAGASANTQPNPPTAAGPTPGVMPLRMPNMSSTIINTPHGRMGVLQVPVMFPFAFPTAPAGQTPAPPAATNNPNSEGLPPMDPSAPNNHTQEIAQLLRQVLQRGAPQMPQPQQAAQTTGADNVGPQPVPETNANANAPLPVGSENNNTNGQPAAANQPPNPRRPVVEIRVDMVFGEDPFGGLFNGGNGQPGQPLFNLNEALGATTNAAAAEGRQATGADVAARQREMERRLSTLMEMRRRMETNMTSAGNPLPPDVQMPQAPVQQQGGQETNEQPPQSQTPPQHPQQPQQQAQQQPQIPPFMPGNFPNMIPGLRFSGTGRSLSEAFAQMLGRIPPPTGQGQTDPGSQPRAENQQQPPAPASGNDQTPPPPPQQPLAVGDAPPLNIFTEMPDFFGDFLRARRRPQRPYKDWTLPPAPGPTLRQRVERREREAGLRCHDVSCGLGPSDEDPFGVDSVLGQATGDMKQLAITSKDDRSELCPHRFHGPCLVSAERVSLRGADAIIEDGHVEVSCPVCRGTGCVSKEDWDEGVASLQ